MRKHGWQRPLHMLQLLGMAIYVILVLAYYLLLASFLGNYYLQTTATAIFSFMAFAVMVLFVRCSSINPIDKTCSGESGRKGHRVLVVRCVKRMEKMGVRYMRIFLSVLLCLFLCMVKRSSSRRPRYRDPSMPSFLTSNLPISATLPQADIAFCSFCNRKVKKHSKHCKSCDKCVDGFDHHCRWLNNCVGRRNYRAFMLLMPSLLIMLLVEGGAGVVAFVRCFAKERGIMHQAHIMYGHRFPRWAFASLLLFITLLSAYASAAIGQLFFFHVVLIKKGIGTYDYILRMREDFVDESSDFVSTPSSPAYSIESFDENQNTSNFLAKLRCLCKHERQHDVESYLPKTEIERASNANASANANININPWRVMKMSKKEVDEAGERWREKRTGKVLMPLGEERKCGPVMRGEMEANMNMYMYLNLNLNSKVRRHSSYTSTSASTSLLPSSTSTSTSPRRVGIVSKSLSFTTPLLLQSFHPHFKPIFQSRLSALSDPLDLSQPEESHSHFSLLDTYRRV